MLKKLFNIKSPDVLLNNISPQNNIDEIKLKNFIYIAIIFRGDNTCFKLKPKIYKALKLSDRSTTNAKSRRRKILRREIFFRSIFVGLPKFLDQRFISRPTHRLVAKKL